MDPGYTPALENESLGQRDSIRFLHAMDLSFICSPVFDPTEPHKE